MVEPNLHPYRHSIDVAETILEMSVSLPVFLSQGRNCSKTSV